MPVVFDSVWPYRRQPTILLLPWDCPSKNTGVGCYFLLQCMKVKSESEVAQSCLTPPDPMDCSLPGSSVHGIFQARVLEWGAIAFSYICITTEYKNTWDKNYQTWKKRHLVIVRDISASLSVIDRSNRWNFFFF